MHANVSSDAVAADEDTTSIVLIEDSGLIFSATQRHSSAILLTAYYWPALLLSVFSIIGVVGNALVCLAIATERRLQNRTNWFLFSLALADMLVSGLVIPLAVLKEFIGKKQKRSTRKSIKSLFHLGSWILGPFLCDLWIFLDVCSCTSSIMHIVVISIDRYLAINDPLNTRSRQRKCKILLLIIIIWLIAILLSSPMIVLGAINPSNIFVDGQCLINNQFFVTYGSVVSFVIPLVIVIIMYTLTVRRLKDQIRQCQTQLAQEQLARAASLVAKPFLRRHIPSRKTNAMALATITSSAQSTPMSATVLRRMRLQRQVTSLELSEESADNSSLHQQKPQPIPSEPDSQIEELPIVPRELVREASGKFSPHTEYACPKNPFCQLKCTCTHQAQQQPDEPVQESKSNLTCCQPFSCCKTSALSPRIRRRQPTTSSGSQPPPISSAVSSTALQTLNSSNRSASSTPRVRQGRRLTITPNVTAARTKSSAVRNEQKAVKVLGVVFVIFVVAWFPFCIMNVLQGVCKRCLINPNILNGFVWLGYVSSTINPLVYTVFNRNFRLKFIALLKCQCSPTTTVQQRQYSYYRSHSSLLGSRFQRKQGLVQTDPHPLNTYREQQELKLLETMRPK